MMYDSKGFALFRKRVCQQSLHVVIEAGLRVLDRPMMLQDSPQGFCPVVVDFSVSFTRYIHIDSYRVFRRLSQSRKYWPLMHEVYGAPKSPFSDNVVC